LEYLKVHAAKLNLHMIDEVQPDAIDAFRTTRGVCALTWTKELQILRNFFNFCMDREWTVRNPASRVAMPKNIQPTDKEPYAPNEMIKIFAACDTFGRYAYERLRARAMVRALRHTALRISDVATLGRDRIRRGEIYLRTLKNGKVVKLPIHPELQKALDAIPVPRGTVGEPRYFFWSGNGTARGAIRDATRTLAAVFKTSGVAGAHPHRFRHTLATELLGAGASFEEVADILGNSPNIVRKYYAKWSQKRQDRISTLLNSVFGMDAAGTETTPHKRRDLRQVS
jgi:integrase